MDLRGDLNVVPDGYLYHGELPSCLDIHVGFTKLKTAYCAVENLIAKIHDWLSLSRVNRATTGP